MADGSVSGGTSDERGPSRRGLLGWTVVIAAAVGAMVAGPVATLFAAPLFRKRAEGEWVPIGPADGFDPAGQDVSFEYERQDGWYRGVNSARVFVRKRGNDFEVISTRCTHAGCGVNWQPDTQQFFCPCHGGLFDANGNVISGPPPAPLAKLQSRVNPSTKQLEILES